MSNKTNREFVLALPGWRSGLGNPNQRHRSRRFFTDSGPESGEQDAELVIDLGRVAHVAHPPPDSGSGAGAVGPEDVVVAGGRLVVHERGLGVDGDGGAVDVEAAADPGAVRARRPAEPPAPPRPPSASLRVNVESRIVSDDGPLKGNGAVAEIGVGGVDPAAEGVAARAAVRRRPRRCRRARRGPGCGSGRHGSGSYWRLR